MQPGFILIFFHGQATHRTGLVAECGSESLVEPQIIPPVHGDEVAKPHMAQLVLDHNAEECQLRDRHVFLRAHNFVRVGNAPDILHRSVLVIGAHNMVHF